MDIEIFSGIRAYFSHGLAGHISLRNGKNKRNFSCHQQRSAGLTQDALHVLAQNVEFQVNGITRLQGMKIGVLVGIGDNRDAKRIRPGVEHRKTHAIDANGAFFDQNIAQGAIKREVKEPTPLPFLDGSTYASLVHVPLHNVPVESAIGGHAPLQIHNATGYQLSQVGFQQGFFHRRYIVRINCKCRYGQANAIVAQALIHFQMGSQRRAYLEREVGAFGGRLNYFPGGLDDASEHRVGWEFVSRYQP